MRINLLLLPLLISIVAEAQTTNTAASFASDPKFSTPLFMTDINGKPLREFNYSDIEGHPFLLEDWNRGTVKFQDGKFAKDIPLQFDLQNNRLYFKRDDQRLEFVQPVSAFAINYWKGGDSVMVLFRNGYPAIDRNSKESFYEVLAEGKLQLLRYQQKAIQEFKVYSGATKKRFIEMDGLYVLLPDGKMTRLKKNKDAILAALPEHAETINKLVAERKIKLTKEEDIILLFLFLNAQ